MRKTFGYEKDYWFPVMHFIELVLPEVDPDFNLDIVEDSELTGVFAETIPAQHTIRVKRSVYEAACKKNGWARMVMAHELGHLYYHNAATVSYAMHQPGQKLPLEKDPEHQADIFAAELLAPSGIIQHRKMNDSLAISKKFGVSPAAAKTQLGYANRAIAQKKQKKTAGRATRP